MRAPVDVLRRFLLPSNGGRYPPSFKLLMNLLDSLTRDQNVDALSEAALTVKEQGHASRDSIGDAQFVQSPG